MDLVDNIAVGAAGLGMNLPLGMGRVSAEPKYFNFAWTDAKWEISKIGWIGEDHYDKITLPDPSTTPAEGMPWAKFAKNVPVWEMRG